VTALLGDEPVVRPGGPDRVEQHALGVAIGVRHHVGRAALRIDAALRPAEALEQERPRRAGGVHRQVEEGVRRHPGESRRAAEGGHIFTCKCWTSSRS
jgi:hypothetical protein